MLNSLVSRIRFVFNTTGSGGQLMSRSQHCRTHATDAVDDTTDQRLKMCLRIYLHNTVIPVLGTQQLSPLILRCSKAYRTPDSTFADSGVFFFLF